MSRQLLRLRSTGLRRTLARAVGGILVVWLAHSLAGDELPPSGRRNIFREDVHPLLKQHCFRCHQGRDSEAGYRLDLRAELLGETNGEPLVVMGNSGASRLVQLVSSDDPDERMPPDGEENLHAMILHAMGIDQHKLFYLHNSRKEIVTVNGADVIQEVFA